MNLSKAYKYNVILSGISKNFENHHQEINLEITNHDNLFTLAELIQGKLELNKDQEQSFLIGLKMFSEIIITNRNHPLLAQLKKPTAEIMSLLKKYVITQPIKKPSST